MQFCVWKSSVSFLPVIDLCFFVKDSIIIFLIALRNIWAFYEWVELKIWRNSCSDFYRFGLTVVCNNHKKQSFASSCVFFQRFLEPGELDPLNRRHATTPGPDICVQGLFINQSFMVQLLVSQYRNRYAVLVSISSQWKFRADKLLGFNMRLGRKKGHLITLSARREQPSFFPGGLCVRCKTFKFLKLDLKTFIISHAIERCRS